MKPMKPNITLPYATMTKKVRNFIQKNKPNSNKNIATFAKSIPHEVCVALTNENNKLIFYIFIDSTDIVAWHDPINEIGFY